MLALVHALTRKHVHDNLLSNVSIIVQHGLTESDQNGAVDKSPFIRQASESG